LCGVAAFGRKPLKRKIGSAVFMGVSYFCLRRFFDAAVWISLAVSIPVGIVGFIVFAKISEDFESHPGEWDNPG